MIVQGANDPRVTQEEVDQFVEAMRKRNLDYEYLLFLDEGHSLRKPENREKFYSAAEKFFAKYLAGHHEIYVMNADGSNQRRLTNHPAGEYWPSWTSGGTENSKKTPQTIDELKRG